MIYIVLSVALNAFAQIAMKSASKEVFTIKAQITNFSLYLAGLFYLVSIALWLKGLSLMPLSKAYPYQSLGYLMVFTFSYFIFGERFTTTQLLGLLVICSGIFVLSFQK